MNKNVKRVALLKYKDGGYLYDSWRGNAYTGDNILDAKQFANVAAAKGVRTRLKNGEEFEIVFATVTIEEDEPMEQPTVCETVELGWEATE